MDIIQFLQFLQALSSFGGFGGQSRSPFGGDNSLVTSDGGGGVQGNNGLLSSDGGGGMQYQPPVQRMNRPRTTGYVSSDGGGGIAYNPLDTMLGTFGDNKPLVTPIASGSSGGATPIRRPATATRVGRG